MPAPAISALTPAPNRLDPNFATVADAFLSGFPTLRAEINAFATYLNTTALVSYAFSDGTAGQPSLRFASDSNTGIFRPAADALGYATSGAERMRIDALGRVGINTSSPAALLDLGFATALNERQAILARPHSGDQAFNLYAGTGGSVATYEDYFKLGIAHGTTKNASINFHRGGSTTGGFLAFSTNNDSEKMRLDHLGYLGIGEGDPDAPLHVKSTATDNMAILENSANNAVLRIQAIASNKNSEIWFGDGSAAGVGAIDYDHADDSMRFRVNSSEKMRLSSDGKLSVGHSGTDGAALDIRKDGSGVQDILHVGNWTTTEGQVGSAIRFGFSTEAAAYGARIVGYGDPASKREGSLSFQRAISPGNWAETLRMADNGSVGIGTSAPANRFTVEGALANIAIVNRTPGDSGTPSFSGLKFYGFGETTLGHIASVEAGNSQSSNTNGILRFLTKASGDFSPLERMRVDHNGLVGIGTFTPTEKLHVAGDIKIATSDFAGVLHFGGTSDAAKIVSIGSTAANQDLEFHTGSTERARINSNGDLVVGKSTPSNSTVGAELRNNGEIAAIRNGGNALYLNRLGTADGTIAIFAKENGQVGTISVTGSATSYNTSSDYRLKADLQPLSSPADRLMQLNPVNVSWKADGSRSDTFIAHELAEVLPYAVTGEKDAVDPDGIPEYQSVDYSKVVPLLTAALQEALNKIEKLETRIKAMEGQA